MRRVVLSEVSGNFNLWSQVEVGSKLRFVLSSVVIMLPTLLCRHKQFVFALCHTRSNRESHPTQVRYCPCVVVVVLRPIVKEVQENGLLRLTQSDADRDVVKRDYFPQTGSIINGLVSRQNNFFGVGMLGFGM